MRSRFGGRRQSGGSLRAVLLPVCFFAAVVAFFLYMLNNVTGSMESEQLKAMEQAVRRTAVHCYAVEGQYPPSLTYLEEHYGLQVDKTRFVVHYQPVAANLMPNISVFSMKELEGPPAEDPDDPFRADGFEDMIALAQDGSP